MSMEMTGGKKNDSPGMHRRAFLKAVAGAAAAFTSVPGARAQTQSEEIRFGNVKVEIKTPLDEAEREGLERLHAVVEEVHTVYPNLFQVIKITAAGEGGKGWSSAENQNGVRTLVIDTVFLAHDTQVLRDLVTHEAGHVVYSLIFFGFEDKAQRAIVAKRMDDLHKLFLEIDSHEAVYAELIDALLQSTYMNTKTGRPHASYRSIPNQGEMFVMAFTVHRLYSAELLKKVQGMNDQEKAMLEKIRSFIPTPAYVAERMQAFVYKK